MQSASNMQRVDKNEFLANIEKYTDIANKNNVGFVITENGVDSLVIFPESWINAE